MQEGKRNKRDQMVAGRLIYFAHAYSVSTNTNIKDADRESYCVNCVLGFAARASVKSLGDVRRVKCRSDVIWLIIIIIINYRKSVECPTRRDAYSIVQHDTATLGNRLVNKSFVILLSLPIAEHRCQCRYR